VEIGEVEHVRKKASFAKKRMRVALYSSSLIVILAFRLNFLVQKGLQAARSRLGLFLGLPTFPATTRDRVEQGEKLGDVTAVSAGGRDGERES
jgi:hypothetical protein